MILDQGDQPEKKSVTLLSQPRWVLLWKYKLLFFFSAMIWIVAALFFYKDGFDITSSTKDDYPLNKETKPITSHNNTNKKFTLNLPKKIVIVRFMKKKASIFLNILFGL